MREEDDWGTQSIGEALHVILWCSVIAVSAIGIVIAMMKGVM